MPVATAYVAVAVGVRANEDGAAVGGDAGERARRLGRPRSSAASTRACRGRRPPSPARASRSTTRPPRRAQNRPPPGRPRRTASHSSPVRRSRRPASGTGAPATVIRTRSMPGTCRRVQASWSTTRESSLGVASSTSRDNGTSATPFSVTTTDRSRSVRDGSAERVTSAIAPGPGEESADEVGRRLLTARDEHRVGQQRPAGLVVEVQVEPREAAVEERRRDHQCVDRVVDAPLSVLGDQPEVERLRPPGEPPRQPPRASRRRMSASRTLAPVAGRQHREGLVDDGSAVGFPGASRVLGEEGRARPTCSTGWPAWRPGTPRRWPRGFRPSPVRAG